MNTTRKEKLADVRNHPEKHRHSFSELQACSFVNGAIDLEILEAHPSLGTNGGTKCDVTEGPCACGAWH